MILKKRMRHISSTPLGSQVCSLQPSYKPMDSFGVQEFKRFEHNGK